MKISRVVLFITVLSLVSLWAFKSSGKPSGKTIQPGFAVIELFTSEGCSSCPPADDLVALISKEYQGKPVYILGFHVDYWNNLGWKDEFSKAEYSQRQRRYASLLKTQSVYTPQIIVNGKKEFVGSAENTLRNAIAGALQKPTDYQLNFSDVHLSDATLNLHYQLNNMLAHSVLMVAFVQKNAISKVKSGENSGHTLSHVNIVRSLSSMAINQNNGGGAFKLPPGFDARTWDAISFVQNTTTGEIVAAQRIMIPGA